MLIRTRFLVRSLAMLSVAAWLAACATTPAPIREAPPGAPQPDEVRADPARFQGSPVRWGGVIAGVDNRASDTLVEVVSRPLGRSGRPRETDLTSGRFLARVPGFLDPAVYAVGRELTVSGRVGGVEPRRVGDYEYPYASVDVDVYYLWAVRQPVYDPYPYYHSPWWYDPWYPYHPFYGPWRRW